MPCPPTPTPATSDSYDGLGLNPDPNQSGTYSSGGFVSASGFPHIIYQNVPANIRVQLSGAGITQIGPNQYRTTLSLSGTNTLSLTPNAADAQNNPTTAVLPNSFSWGFVSRNTHIATVNSSGLVTAIARGECEIQIRSFRQVNASFTGSTPSGTEGVDASLSVIVVP